MLPSTDINQRLVQDLADPERGPATVDALLGLGHGAFDHLSWHGSGDPQDPETVHAASLWNWACQIAGITPAMQRLARSIPEQLRLQGDRAPDVAWTLFQNDAWGVLNQAQRNVNVSNRAWTLLQALDHLTLCGLPHDAVRVRFPCAVDDGTRSLDPTMDRTIVTGVPPWSWASTIEQGPALSPEVQEADPRWRTPVGRAVLHTLMAWVLSVKDEEALRLIATTWHAGLPPAAWWEVWALRADPVARAFAHRTGSPWVAPYLMHLAQHDRWALVMALLSPSGSAGQAWQRVTLYGLDDSPMAGRVVVDDLASKALRRAMSPDHGVMFDHNLRSRAKVFERLIADALDGDLAARTLLDQTVHAPLTQALQENNDDRWSSRDVGQALLARLQHYTERRALEALPLPQDLPVHQRARL